MSAVIDKKAKKRSEKFPRGLRYHGFGALAELAERTGRTDEANRQVRRAAEAGARD